MYVMGRERDMMMERYRMMMGIERHDDEERDITISWDSPP
jgi:hypothetical protein